MLRRKKKYSRSRIEPRMFVRLVEPANDAYFGPFYTRDQAQSWIDVVEPFWRHRDVAFEIGRLQKPVDAKDLRMPVGDPA